MNKSQKFIKEIIDQMIDKKSIPKEIRNQIPKEIKIAGKAKLDQIYDTAIHVAFPGYSKAILERMLSYYDKDVKIWRVLYPSKLNLPHILIRAKTFHQAFALACDYACRHGLNKQQEIPKDLQIRVMFMSERAVRRHLNIRKANRMNRRKKANIIQSREFTPREINGALTAAFGRPSDPNYRIIRYVNRNDSKELRKIGHKRTSAIEYESRK